MESKGEGMEWDVGVRVEAEVRGCCVGGAREERWGEERVVVCGGVREGGIRRDLRSGVRGMVSGGIVGVLGVWVGGGRVVRGR